MFDVLIYLYETYWRPETCPSAEQLSQQLSDAGFERNDIHAALNWLNGLKSAAHSNPQVAGHDSTRIYSEAEIAHLGPEGIAFLNFLSSVQALTPHMRELVIDRVQSIPFAPVELHLIKICVLMVYWTVGYEPDALILDELIHPLQHHMLH
ncbi:DUF494 family protein [Saezia sanguinis]|jgi:Smg protein|uniref:DUF494 family protein n=1 Tax=Saezia sanguinis TaxID=1965230 RepID=UPI003060227B